MSTGPATNGGKTTVGDIPITDRLGTPPADTTFENEQAGTADNAPVAAGEVPTALPRDAVGDSIIRETSSTAPRTVNSEDFYVNPRDVLDGAQGDNPQSIVVAYVNADGKFVLASSHGTPLTLDLLRRATNEARNPS